MRKLARLIGQLTLPGADGARVEKRLQVLGELLHRGITFPRLGPHGFGEDNAEVTPHGGGHDSLQHGGQRVDVRGGPDAATRELLRARVIRRQHADVGDLGIDLRFQNLGDAEVEHLGFAIGGDQNIAGFQIAMHHQVPMQIGDRRADFQKQLDLVAIIQRAGESVERFTLHVFHGQVSLAVSGVPGIQQVRDVGMGETGEDLPFLKKSFLLTGESGPE